MFEKQEFLDWPLLILITAKINISNFKYMEKFRSNLLVRLSIKF